ncbi:MAG TPA: alpha/beta hydrolase-fold protein [Gammaproteobacteria bacterium]|nr:alpha/beta hydrolase-fold protein [Gammaproteobacteria bacterium]
MFDLRALLSPLALLIAAYLPSCAGYLPAQAPMETRSYPAGAERSRALVVFLPGLRDRASDFQARGFVQGLHRHHLAVDAIAADAHVNYYTKGTFKQRLQQDVIRPARDRGYAEIWLVGISLGGFGALRYAQTHPGQITGVLALSPYLGEPEDIRAVLDGAAPSPEAKRRANGGFPTDSLWRWLRDRETGTDSGVRIFLGYGRDEEFARACGLMAATLPPGRVLSVAGKHRWSTWKHLWRQFLEGPPPSWGAGPPAAAGTS